MSYDKAMLDQELAAYRPDELAELADTVAILLTAFDDGSTHFHNMRWRIESGLSAAIEKRLSEATKIDGASNVVQLKQPKDE